MSGHDPDESYDEYLWGEISPRAFARRLKLGGRKTISKLEIQIDESVDLSNVVPR